MHQQVFEAVGWKAPRGSKRFDYVCWHTYFIVVPNFIHILITFVASA